MQIYISLPQYQFQGLKTWITRIAVNKAIDFKRKLNRQKEDLTDTLDFLDPMPDRTRTASKPVESLILHREAQRRIQHKLDELPPNYRDVMYAYYIEEKTYHDIATEQGVAIKTVESKLYRAKQWVRKHGKEEDWT